MTPEDFMRARQPEREPRDWSVIVLWVSLMISGTMITATLMWNLGKSLRIASYLKNHGVKTCVELHHPPGQKKTASSPFDTECEGIVERRHDPCIDATEYLREDLLERRSEYMACVMSDANTQQTALNATK